MIRIKTNAKCGGCVAEIGEQLNTFLSPDQWSLDLMVPEKVLTVRVEVPVKKVIDAVKSAGFKAELL